MEKGVPDGAEKLGFPLVKRNGGCLVKKLNSAQIERPFQVGLQTCYKGCEHVTWLSASIEDESGAAEVWTITHRVTILTGY